MMWLKLFRKRKSQTVMIVIVILLCTILLNGAITILTSLKAPYDKLKKECNPADLIAYSYLDNESETEQLKERFEKMKETKSVVKIFYSYIQDEITVGNKKIDAYMDLVEYKKEGYHNLRFVEGSKKVEKELEAGKCYIPACIQNEYHLKTGDVVTIKNSEGDVNYTIAGVFVEPYSTSTAFDSAVLVNKIPESFANKKICIRVFAKDGYDGNDIKEAYQKEYKGIFPGYIATVDGMISDGLIAVNIVAALFLAIGIIMLVVSGLIINFMIRQAMYADAKDIAIYKTMGYTNFDMLRIYLMFYFSLTAVTCILGTFASKLLANQVLGGLFANLGQNSDVNVFNTGIWCMLVVVLFILSLVYLVIRKAKNVKPIYAMNGMKNSNTKKKKKYGKSSINFSPIGIALRNIRRDKKGVLGIVITIIFTIFSVNFGIISLDVAFSQKDNNDYWIGVDPSDVIVNVTDPDCYDDIEKIVKKHNKVEGYVNVSQNERVYLNWNKVSTVPNISTFIYDDYSKVKLPVIEGRNPKYAKEIALGAVVAKEQKKEVGDYITVYLDSDTKVNLLITGIFQTYYQMGNACRLCSSLYREENMTMNYNMCSIYLKKGVDNKNFIHDLSEKIGNKGEVILRTESHAAIMNMIVNPQKQGIPPVIVLEFVIGAMNIFCIVMLKNAANQKNNEIYKSIGYTTKDLVLSNMYYVGIVGIVSLLAAIPLCIVLYPDIMKLCLGTFGFRSYPITINVFHMVLGNACAFALFIVSTLVSSFSLRKINVRDLVIE